jgi:hypothetical protein
MPHATIRHTVIFFIPDKDLAVFESGTFIKFKENKKEKSLNKVTTKKRTPPF